MATQQELPARNGRTARVLVMSGPHATHRRARLIVLAGLPGSGKSTLARAIRARTSATVLESDAIRKLLFPQPTYSLYEHRTVFAVLRQAAATLLLGGTSVVIDATNLRATNRAGYQRLADRAAVDDVLVWVQAREDVVLARLRRPHPERLSDATPAIYFAMRESMRLPREPYILVDTTDPIDASIEALAGIINEP